MSWSALFAYHADKELQPEAGAKEAMMATLHDCLDDIKTIRVGPSDFMVVWDGPLLRALNRYSQTDYVKGEVTFDPDLSIQKGRVAVVHEGIHQIDETFQLEMKEREVTLLANALVMLFRDNPWLGELL